MPIRDAKPPQYVQYKIHRPPRVFVKVFDTPSNHFKFTGQTKGNILFKNCTRIAKVRYYKNCTVQFLSRRFFVQFLCYVTYFKYNGTSTRSPCIRLSWETLSVLCSFVHTFVGSFARLFVVSFFEQA